MHLQDEYDEVYDLLGEISINLIIIFLIYCIYLYKEDIINFLIGGGI